MAANSSLRRLNGPQPIQVLEIILQKQRSRQRGNSQYLKYRITIPIKFVRETGWTGGERLEITCSDGTLTIVRAPDRPQQQSNPQNQENPPLGPPHIIYSPL